MHVHRALPAIAVLVLALAACQREAPAGPGPAVSAPAIPAEPAPPGDQPDAYVPPAQATGTNVPAVVDGVVSFQGFGPAAFGSDAEQVRMAWGNDLGNARPSEPGGCYYLAPPAIGTSRYDIGFMVEGDRFSRIDVGNAGYTAPGGGKAGMARAEIERLYAGRVEAAPHKYVEGAHTLRVIDADGGTAALVFETDAGGTVTGWRIGVPPQVDYVERCG
ncbi:lectin [Luteimonas sp. XNQY3]|nr:lectin [Luteimonas sp. XNQY3]MCD9005726.1 lectin [Luteimonas sp. XNQY3]